MQPIIAVPATLLLVYRAWSHNSLTPVGICTAASTAIAHAYHPWNVFFALLVIFFLLGTAVTKVKHEKKATLTASSTGGSDLSAPHPRTATQVLANSLTASILIVIHAFYIRSHQAPICFSPPDNFISLLPYGIMSHYAAVAADTFSSELGILASTQPFLITDFAGLLKLRPRQVPRGTNGGVTLEGLAAGAGGAAAMAGVAILLSPYCPNWKALDAMWMFIGITACGLCGSILDSIMGGLLQASVVDTRDGRVIEGDGGEKVAYQVSQGKNKQGEPGRKLLIGRDILSNNGVNFLMATTMSLAPMAILWLSR